VSREGDNVSKRGSDIEASLSSQHNQFDCGTRYCRSAILSHGTCQGASSKLKNLMVLKVDYNNKFFILFVI